ncbi:MAG: 2-octaprenyl-6-methoxyphenyl hydroxylase [Xanthomonadales bacterium]|jgi:2-octaprenyl-6-methoxyphenol hydroxylase|nr:2-octaprenyl-6-methoxyphenyl hydroxylase [Xanthomonadales bacterium]
MTPERTDVLVVGGGLVGASLACALAPLGLEVTLLEAAAPRQPDPPSYDDRTLALGAASCRILEGLGLWAGVADSATAIRQVTVTERGRPGHVLMDAAAMGLPAFGHVVEARAFGEAVLRRLEALEGVRFEWPVRATGLEQENGRVTVTAERDGQATAWSARLVIGADGANSSIRSLLGIDAHSHEYGQVAVICNVTPEVFHDHRAFERMTDTGPFALLPHVGERCGLVWCVPEEAGQALLDTDEAAFLARATERSGGALGDLQRCGRRSLYPLRRVVPERDRDGRVLLLGNAAHAIHPVGAQGFNLGLRDVAVLAELIADAQPGAGPGAGPGADPGIDPGADHLLERYSEWRRPDHASTVGWSHDMVQLFASQSPLTRLARSAALTAVGLSPTLQRRLASRAMGYRGRVPRLALGEPLGRAWEPNP